MHPGRLRRLGLLGMAFWLSMQYVSAATDSLTFASFQQKVPNQLALTLTNNGISGVGKMDTFSSSLTPIWFSIDQDAPTTLPGTGMAGTTIDAYLWLTATTNTTATQFGSVLDQPFNNGTTIQIQSKADYLLGNQNYLLVAFYQLGDMVGTANQRSSTEFNGTDVIYSSHYLNMSAAANGALGLGFSNITPKYKIRNNGLVDSFTASSVGTFSAEFTPEPETYLLFATCLFPLLWKARQWHRQKFDG